MWQPSIAPTTRGKPLKRSKPSATSTALAPYSKEKKTYKLTSTKKFLK